MKCTMMKRGLKVVSIKRHEAKSMEGILFARSKTRNIWNSGANIETISHIKEKEHTKLESVQYKILKGVFELAHCTLYCCIIVDSGIWPVMRKNYAPLRYTRAWGKEISQGNNWRSDEDALWEFRCRV